MSEPQVITYSLRAGHKCSCPFSQDRAIFTDEVVTQGEQSVGTLVDDYLAFLRQIGGEAAGSGASQRTRAEYLLELLVMGVLWRAYGKNALALSGAAARVLGGLSDLRERNARLKKPADIVRGLFAFRLRPSQADSPSFLSADQLGRLLRWMRAAGRLKQETRRLESWHAFLAHLPGERIRRGLSDVSEYAAWFENRSLAALGGYTPNVESFLANKHPGYRWREDFILCGRKRVEYHLNMVGTEILNRALRADFLRAEKKVVLVPPCMRALSDDGDPDSAQQELRCKAVSTPFGARCMACTPGCRVHQLTRLGEKYGFAVFTLPDDLRVFSGASIPAAGREHTGIVGISCVLTNIQGGWDVRDLGIPAQGLLLDYCGCSYHWHKEGIATDVDVHQLLEVMGIDHS